MGIKPTLWESVMLDSDAGRDWGQEEKGMTEDEMAGWHHWLDGLESGWTLGVGDGQGGLAGCDSWGCKESDTTERLNWTELNVSEPLIKTSHLGQAHWWPLAWVVSQQEVLSRRIREVPKEERRHQPITLSCPPPRILHVVIHLGWKMYMPPERPWVRPEKGQATQKPTSLPQNLRLWATWQSSSPGFPYPTALCLGTPSQ